MTYEEHPVHSAFQIGRLKFIPDRLQIISFCRRIVNE
jgi:hypothetical protein